MTRRWVFYPFLIALYPIVSLYAQNVTETPASETVGPLGLMLAAAALVWSLLRLGLRDPARAGLLTVLAVAVFFTINLVPGWANERLYEINAIWVERDVHVAPIVPICAELAATAALAYLVIVRLRDPGEWTAYLNGFSLILIGLPLTTITPELLRAPATKGGPPPAVAAAHKVGRLPDIYYIILDGYARTDVMKELFGFDNRPFLDRLERKGFYVARQSHSNYCQTPLSISSSLNATYLDGAIPSSSRDKSQLHKWIGDGSVVRTLRGLGYRFVAFPTGFDETECPEADLYLAPYTYISGFHRMLLDRTPLGCLSEQPVFRDGYAMARDRTNFVFETLPSVARVDGPTFTFAHILSPHPPFIFGPEGQDVSPRGHAYFLNDGDIFLRYYGGGDVYRSGYRDQATYLTRQVERMIDRVLDQSPEPPVIILQSDHGSGLGLDFSSAERTDHRERMSILDAYYLPGRADAGLYQSITPVNSFRVVFNAYFGAGLELAPDRSYYSSWDEPFKFIDVTERLGDRDEGTDQRARATPAEGATRE